MLHLHSLPKSKRSLIFLGEDRQVQSRDPGPTFRRLKISESGREKMVVKRGQQEKDKDMAKSD